MRPRQLAGATEEAVRLLRLRAVLMAVGGALATATWLRLPTLDGSIVWSSLALTAASIATAAALMLTLRAAGGGTWLHLGPMFCIYFGLSFGLSSVAWVDPPLQGSAVVVPVEEVPNAVALAAAGIVAFGVGYMMRHSVLSGVVRAMRTSLVGRAGPAELRHPAVPAAVWAVGFVVSLLSLRSGRFGYLADPTALLASAGPFAQLQSIASGFMNYGLALAVVDATRTRTVRTRLVVAIMVIGQLPLILLSGSKQELIITGATVLLSAAYTGVRLPRRAIVVALLLAPVIYPLNAAYRADVVQADGSRAGAAAASSSLPAAVSGTLSEHGFIGTYTLGLTQAFSRSGLIANLTLVQARSPSEIPFKPATDLLVAPIAAAVPRALWPDKPVYDTGLQFARQYWDQDPSILSANAVTVPGDLYRHGGVLVLVLGLAVYGHLARVLDSELHPHADVRLLFAFIGIAIVMTKNENATFETLAGALQTLVTLGLLGRVCFRRSPKAEGESAWLPNDERTTLRTA